MNSELEKRVNRLVSSSEDLLRRQREANCVDLRYLDEANVAIQSAKEADMHGNAEDAWGEISRAESYLSCVRKDLDIGIRLLAEVGKVFKLGGELSPAEP